MKITKTFTYKLVLSNSDKLKLDKILESTTFCYNLFLYYNRNYFEKTKKNIELSKMFSQLPVFTKQYQQLQETNNIYFNSTIVDLFFSLKKIYSIEKYPDYKKNNRRIVLLREFQVNEKDACISIPDFASIRYVKSRKLQGTIKAIHLVTKFDNWYVDFVVEQNTQPNRNQSELRFVGIDVGLNDFAILSNGTKVKNPRFYRNMEEKLIKEQKSLSRKERGSENWKKQLEKVRKVHEKIFNSRMNFLHELTTYLTDEFDVIGIEKLAISEMKENRKLAKSIQDASWGTFVKLLKYKANEKGKVVVEVDRYYPSTKTCSNCGNKEIIPLHLRTFECSRCQFKVHRDYNASINIEHKAVHYAFTHNLSGSRG